MIVVIKGLIYRFNPASREQLKQYVLRTLGKPVIEINVDDDQLEDRLDEALQYFELNITMMVLKEHIFKYKVVQADVDAMTTDIEAQTSSKTGLDIILQAMVQQLIRHNS